LKKEQSDYSPLDFEGIKEFRSMKNWKAGKCNGKKIASFIILPIHIDVDY
jgi:hypothetical protein